MQAVRQLASGLPYAIVSLLLVVGSLSLSLAEKSPVATPSATATASPSLMPTATATAAPPTDVLTATPTPVIVTAAATSTTILYPTTYASPYPTARPRAYCGPFPGWVKAYVVQPGDTLFHIAVNYGTSVGRLEYANCKNTSVIFVGERLWVPSYPTITPALTLIPTFDTPTDYPTESITSTPSPTDTSVPTASDTQDP